MATRENVIASPDQSNRPLRLTVHVLLLLLLLVGADAIGVLAITRWLGESPSAAASPAYVTCPKVTAQRWGPGPRNRQIYVLQAVLKVDANEQEVLDPVINQELRPLVLELLQARIARVPPPRLRQSSLAQLRRTLKREVRTIINRMLLERVPQLKKAYSKKQAEYRVLIKNPQHALGAVQPGPVRGVEFTAFEF